MPWLSATLGTLPRRVRRGGENRYELVGFTDERREVLRPIQQVSSRSQPEPVPCLTNFLERNPRLVDESEWAKCSVLHEVNADPRARARERPRGVKSAALSAPRASSYFEPPAGPHRSNCLTTALPPSLFPSAGSNFTTAAPRLSKRSEMSSPTRLTMPSSR